MDARDRALQLVELLEEARHFLNCKTLALAETKGKLSLVKALAEKETIDQAGGEKGLGPNSETRKRELLLAVEYHPGYRGAVNELRSAQTLRDDAYATKQALYEEWKTLVSFAGQSE
jgi:hypothetical protein